MMLVTRHVYATYRPAHTRVFAADRGDPSVAGSIKRNIFNYSGEALKTGCNNLNSTETQCETQKVSGITVSSEGFYLK
jgi:hypothetical protein